MSQLRALLLTDVVDSTRLNDELGDAAANALWAAHDAAARELVRRWQGQEIGRSDGFLLVFPQVGDAAAFALGYRQALAALPLPMAARVGIHFGAVELRHNSAADVAQGATPFEVDGLALPTAARVMAAASGGQALLSAAAAQALAGEPAGREAHGRLTSHGHWRMKGLQAPVELFELGDGVRPPLPPADSDKAYRVVASGDLWQPARVLPHTLPAERDRFVGRADTLQALAERLERGARLVTLLGMGGIGKTRLAQRYAHCWLGDYPGGAWFCDLSSARSEDGITHAVAHGLEVPLGSADAVQQLGAAIAGRGPCLVILDNFEQVARHAEPTLGAWLERAPQARFIATSREVLGIVGEQALLLAPLPDEEAISVFRERVAALGISNRFAADDEAALAPLVRLLDGLPLAIELAAARARVMPPRLLLRRMGERFKLLTSRSGRHDRQATLRATLDWSWELLSAAEQSALAQLSVFEGGFTLEAAEAVLEIEGDGSGAAPEVVDLLQALVEKSLLRQGAANRRFGVLRSVQEYAAWRLGHAGPAGDPANPSDAALRRHAAYFAGLSEAAASGDHCAETENLVAACQRAASRRHGALAAELLVNAWAALRLSGPFGVAAGLADAVRALDLPSGAARARAAWVAASALDALGDTSRARALLDEAIDEPALPPAVRACLLCTLGEVMSKGETAAHADSELQAALALAVGCGDAALECRAHNALGALAFGQGRTAPAREHYERALVLARRSGDERWEGGLLGNLGLLSYTQGRFDEARTNYERAIDIASRIGDRRWEGNTRCNLGLLHQEQGRSDEARLQFDAALAMARHMGHRRLEGTVMCNLGVFYDKRNLLDEAQSCFMQAVGIANTMKDARAEAVYLSHLGLTNARQGNALYAKSAFGEGQKLLARVPDATAMAMLMSKKAMAFFLLNSNDVAKESLAAADAWLSASLSAPEAELANALSDARRLIEGSADFTEG